MSDLADPTPVEEGCIPSPAQLLYRWEQADDEKRLALCALALDHARLASICFEQNHEGAMHFAKTHSCADTWHNGYGCALDDLREAYRKNDATRDPLTGRPTRPVEV